MAIGGKRKIQFHPAEGREGESGQLYLRCAAIARTFYRFHCSPPSPLLSQRRVEIVKAVGNPELARNSLLDKERGAFSKVNAAKVLAARREQEGWMERVEEHRSPLLPFEYIYISFCFVRALSNGAQTSASNVS